MSTLQFWILMATVLAGVIWQRVDYRILSERIDLIDLRLQQFRDDFKNFYRHLDQ